MSVASCQECLAEHASPLWAVHANIEMCGGPDEVADWFKESIRSFNDGHYIGWPEILALMPEDQE